MPSLSSCPACLGDITIPSLPDPLRRLRCPLCQEEFPAHQALATSRRFPPEAVPVGAELSTAPHLQHGAAEPSESTASVPAAAGASHSAAPFSLAPIEMPPGGVTGDVGPGLMLAAAMHQSPQPPDEQHPPGSDPLGAGPDANDEQASSLATAHYQVQSRPRQAQKQVGWIGQLIGMVAGAAVGLAIGYYVLLWIGGARADFLDIRDKLPGWMLPASVKQLADARPPAGRDLAGSSSLADAPTAPSSEDSAAPAPSSGPPVSPGQTSLPGQPAQQPPAPSGHRDPPTPEPATSEASGPTTQANGPSAEAGQAAGLAPSSPSMPASPVQLGPRQFTPYSPAEMAAVLDETRTALACSRCGSTGLVPVDGDVADPDSALANAPTTTCPECNGRRSPRVTPTAFQQLCRLAEAVTFVLISEDDPSFSNRRAAVQTLLIQVAADGENRHDIGRLAGMRLDDANRPSDGLALCGTIEQTGQRDLLYEIRIVLFGVPRPVTVVSRQLPDPLLKVGDRVLILGSIIDNPRQHCAGYTGGEPQIVWGGLPQKLAAPQE